MMALSEEQSVAIEVKDVCPPGANSLMLILWISKGTGPQTPECLSVLLCLRRFLWPPSFSGVWHGVNWCEEIRTACSVVCLSHGNIPLYQAGLPVDYHGDDSFLSCAV